MDISVSRLNGRLASKLPPELPLGLVFVVGQVLQLDEHGFVLAEGTDRLNCRTAEAITVSAGDEIRASGHLMFDPQQLQYYLLARDIEVVTSEPAGDVGDGSRELLVENEGLLSALAAVKARAEAAPEVEGDELPVWVKKLAPPEVQAEGAEGDPTTDSRAAAAGQAELNEDLVTILSAAMDSEEEMELTPELLAPYVPEPSEPVEDEGVAEAMGEETAVALADLSTSYRPANRQDTDWLVILLIISFFVLTIAAVVTIILLIVQ